jgi:hypothetical protein
MDGMLGVYSLEFFGQTTTMDYVVDSMSCFEEKSF